MMKAAVLASAHLAEGSVAGGYRTSGHGRRFARVAVLKAVATASLLLAASQGLANWTPAIATLAYGWAGLLVFFALVRSGWSNGRADPTLSFELLMFAISVVVMSYGLLDIARGAALELLCLLLAFGMDRLSARQLCKASFFAACMLALTSLARIALGAGAVRVHAEVFNLLMATVLLPVSVVVGGEIGRLHRRQAAQRGELASAFQRLTQVSLHDGLTGLPNRPHMLRMIEETRLQSKATGEVHCLALLDIDWFKRVNDGYGHAVGDLVLKDFARLMTAALEGPCAFGRWGGEEFLLLMPACAPLRAQAVLSACRQKMAAHVWGARTNGLHVTFSAGIAGSRAGETVDDMLQRADRALYLAKENGRNRSEIDAEEIGGTPSRSPALFKVPHAACPANRWQAAPAPGRSVPSSSTAPDVPAGLGRRRGDGRARRDMVAGARRAWVRLADAVLGDAPDIRDDLRLPLIACALHAVWMAVAYFYAMPHGEIAVWSGWIVIGYESLSALGFYAAIRCGWSRRFADGGLVLAQMLAATTMGAFGYVTAPAMRPSILHMLCVIQVFGMANLKPGQAKFAGTSAIAILCAVILCLTWMHAPDWNAEIMKLALACMIVRQLSLLSHGYGTVREQVFSDRLRLEDAVAQVQEQVTHDPLTGLFNRGYMEEAIAKHYAAWLDGGPHFCLGILDLDHFKRINDEKGHHVGDSVLIALAQASRQGLRDSDLLCRWGGEEFMCLLPVAACEATSRAAMTRLRAAFLDTLSEVPGIDWNVTFSSGFARPCDGVTPEALIALADAALYSAKQGGRDRDVFATLGNPVAHGEPA